MHTKLSIMRRMLRRETYHAKYLDSASSIEKLVGLDHNNANIVSHGFELVRVLFDVTKAMVVV
jgi:hypothetical protein